jgi:hypothetical protein
LRLSAGLASLASLARTETWFDQDSEGAAGVLLSVRSWRKGESDGETTVSDAVSTLAFHLREGIWTDPAV